MSLFLKPDWFIFTLHHLSETVVLVFAVFLGSRATPALSAGIFFSNRHRPDRRHSPVPGQWPLSSSLTCTDKSSSTEQITTRTWRSISSRHRQQCATTETTGPERGLMGFAGLVGVLLLSFVLKQLQCDQIPSKTHLLHAAFFRNTCRCLHRQRHNLFGFMSFWHALQSC